MPVIHEPWLVALSLVMAFQGSFVGLNLAVQVGQADPARRRLLLAGAALTLALAIWSMHFVGMLAADCRWQPTFSSCRRCCPFWSACSWWALPFLPPATRA